MELSDQAKGLVPPSALQLGGLLNVQSLSLRAIDAEISARPNDSSLVTRRARYADVAVATLKQLLQLDPSARSRLSFDPEMWPALDEAANRNNADREEGSPNDSRS